MCRSPCVFTHSLIQEIIRLSNYYNRLRLIWIFIHPVENFYSFRKTGNPLIQGIENLASNAIWGLPFAVGGWRKLHRDLVNIVIILFMCFCIVMDQYYSCQLLVFLHRYSGDAPHWKHWIAMFSYNEPV
jgi:hypothetical protein